MPHWHHCAIARSTTHQTQKDGRTVLDVYPRSLAPQDTLGGHLEFALKYDGVSLGILAAIFAQVKQDDVVAYIRSKPLGK